jgi:membrane protein DedA with SNARE-associated domain
MSMDVQLLVAHYGYLAVFGLILIESIGLPLPGEAALIAAALFAGRTHQLDIIAVIATAALAAGLGTAIGYGLGRWAGDPLIDRYGRYVGLTPARRRLGRFLFLQHGAKIVFFGRFVAILRTFAGALAGINAMPQRRFAMFNVLGAAIWSLVIGGGAYAFGRAFAHMARPLGLSMLALTVLAVILGLAILRGQEKRLQTLADAALADGEA